MHVVWCSVNVQMTLVPSISTWLYLSSVGIYVFYGFSSIWKNIARPMLLRHSISILFFLPRNLCFYYTNLWTRQPVRLAAISPRLEQQHRRQPLYEFSCNNHAQTVFVESYVTSRQRRKKNSAYHARCAAISIGCAIIIIIFALSISTLRYISLIIYIIIIIIIIIKHL